MRVWHFTYDMTVKIKQSCERLSFTKWQDNLISYEELSERLRFQEYNLYCSSRIYLIFLWESNPTEHLKSLFSILLSILLAFLKNNTTQRHA